MRTAFLFLACASLVFSQKPAQKKPITLETMEEAARLAPQGPGNPVAWAPDGKQFLYRQSRRLVIYDPATGSSKDLIDTAAMDSAAVRPAPLESRPFDWENRRVRETPVQWVGGEVLYSSGGDVFVIQIRHGQVDPADQDACRGARSEAFTRWEDGGLPPGLGFVHARHCVEA